MKTFLQSAIKKQIDQHDKHSLFGPLGCTRVRANLLFYFRTCFRITIFVITSNAQILEIDMKFARWNQVAIFDQVINFARKTRWLHFITFSRLVCNLILEQPRYDSQVYAYLRQGSKAQLKFVEPRITKPCPETSSANLSCTKSG